MDKKIMIIGVIIAVLLIMGIPAYESYQNEMLSENFNKTIQNASYIESEVINATEKFNHQNTTDVDELISTINNDMAPKYSEELYKLNETAQFTHNDTEHNYIDLQIKRITLESENLNATVTTLNAISQFVRGEKGSADAQQAIDNANTLMSKNNEELNKVYSDIKSLLSNNPDLDKKLHDLKLEKSYYGESNIQANTQNLTNTTENTTQ
ncbi:MAG: hypothetical protein E7Z84_05495 [Methanosphaera stadtmanae]|nr:hypothetical protein [Methanosphaera stadtmanae]